MSVQTLVAAVASVQLSYFLQQILPLLVVFLVPLAVLAGKAHWRVIHWLTVMVLENLGLNYVWTWMHDHGASTHVADKPKPRRTKHVRTRSMQMQQGDHQEGEQAPLFDGEDCFPGLVNVSGTYCFLNSVLQAMASLSYLHPSIESMHARAVELDVPTPVLDALRDALQALNTPKSSPSSLRPIPIITALSSPAPGKSSRLFSSREHQDAQELFQLLSECIKNESLAIEKEGQRDKGLGGLSDFIPKPQMEAGKSVFDGLTANRRSCVQCGYTEAVMHFAFDNWQLAVPRATGACTLDDCLADYIRLELLTDCICRKCSMLATYRRLMAEAEKIAESVLADPNPSPSKKKRLREARKLEVKVKAAIDEGRIEEDIKGVKMEKVFSKASTKQAMVARPPPVLTLHLNRSLVYGGYTGKNSCKVMFPEILDLTPYTTSGKLSTLPSVPISVPPPPIPRSTTPTQSTYATPRVLYRLAAVICHYGQHSFGHYVCFRRKPRPPPVPQTRGSVRYPIPPRLACPIGCECKDCIVYGPVRDPKTSDPYKGWLRISDEAVDECGWERVRAEGVGAYMLFYERVVPWRPSMYALQDQLLGSQETVRPELISEVSSSIPNMTLNGIGLSSVGAIESGRRIGPRIARSATAGRGRSLSVSTIRMTDMPKMEVNGIKPEDVQSTSTLNGNGYVNGNGTHHPMPPTFHYRQSEPINIPRKGKDADIHMDDDDSELATPTMPCKLNGTSSSLAEKNLASSAPNILTHTEPHKNPLRNGVNGMNGVNGTNSVSGLNGYHVVNGHNGVNGINGVNGKGSRSSATHSPSPSSTPPPSSPAPQPRNMLYGTSPTARIKSPKPLRPHLAGGNAPISLGLLA